MRNQSSATTTTAATIAPTATVMSQGEEAGRLGVALLIVAYSAASSLRPCARAEHSAMTREARAIGLVR